MLVQPLLFTIALAALVVAALRHGGWQERLAAFVIVAASFLSPFVQERGFANPEIGVLFVDFFLFAVFAAIALRSDRFWPIWAAGFQLGGLAVHLAAARMPGILPEIYLATLIIWSYPVVIVVLLGTWHEGRRHHPA
jgi:uncharacterized membrane protein YjjP (DUF1212 family)